MPGQVTTILSGLLACGTVYYSGLLYAAIEPFADVAAVKLHTMADGTFLENVVARPNGQLLLTTLMHPHVYLYDPSTPDIAPRLFAQVPASTPPVNGISGITPLGLSSDGSTNDKEERYAVVGADWRIWEFKGTDMAIWGFDAAAPAAASINDDGNTVLSMTKLVNLPADSFGNGLIQHPFHPQQVLVADSYRGCVWRADTATGAVEMALEDDTMTPAPEAPRGVPLGINGLRYSNGYLYWTNSNRGLLCAKTVDWEPEASKRAKAADAGVEHIHAGLGHDVTTTAKTHVIVRVDPLQQNFDDFVLGEDGLDLDGHSDSGAIDGPSSSAWVTSHFDSLFKVDGHGRHRVVVGGEGQNSTILGAKMGPTAITWGRGSRKNERTLYVVTGDGDITAVDTHVVLCEEQGGKMFLGRFCLGSSDRGDWN